jgi:hypothetical protein
MLLTRAHVDHELFHAGHVPGHLEHGQLEVAEQGQAHGHLAPRTVWTDRLLGLTNDMAAKAAALLKGLQNIRSEYDAKKDDSPTK